MAAPGALHAIDLAIVVTYLGGMVLVGYLVAGRIRRFSDFFLAGRALTTPLLVCSASSPPATAGRSSAPPSGACSSGPPTTGRPRWWGVLATAMSTVDSYLLLAAGNLVYDIYRLLRRPDADDRTLIAYTRASLVASAAACALIGLYFERIKEAWNFMATVLTSTLLETRRLAMTGWDLATWAAAAVLEPGALVMFGAFLRALIRTGAPGAALGPPPAAAPEDRPEPEVGDGVLHVRDEPPER